MLRADPRIRLPRRTWKCGNFCSLTWTRSLTNSRPRWPGKPSKLGVLPFTIKPMKKRPRKPKPRTARLRVKLPPRPRHLQLPSQISQRSERSAKGLNQELPDCEAQFDEKNVKRSWDGSAGDGVLRDRTQAEFAPCPGEHEFAAGALLGRSGAPGLQGRPTT